MKFNITARELEKALEYANLHGRSKYFTITMTTIPGAVGDAILISNDWDDKDPIDITNYESW